jgi:acyl carrier protein
MPMSWIDFTGYAAALAVLGAFCMTGIIPLRVLAIVSNILFAAYGILAHLYPVFLLHLVLLPINLGKLTRLLQGERGALVRSGGRGRAKKSENAHCESSGCQHGRITDETHFTDDLGADWLDRLELIMVIEDQFVGVEITDTDFDQIEVVGDLIHYIETASTGCND